MPTLTKQKLPVEKCKMCHTFYNYDDYEVCPTCGHDPMTEANDPLLELDESGEESEE
jgi:rRNA maturation endonuclease Nob1